MTESPHKPFANSLRREVGIFGATMMGLGAIVGTGIFVSVGHAAGVAGDWILVAIGVAAIVATLNGLSSAQLAAVHPVSGGAYRASLPSSNRLLGLLSCIFLAFWADPAIWLLGLGLIGIGLVYSRFVQSKVL